MTKNRQKSSSNERLRLIKVGYTRYDAGLAWAFGSLGVGRRGTLAPCNDLPSLELASTKYFHDSNGLLRKTMARLCEMCGKGPQMGNRVETRGKAKYLGGVGTKITGISRRQFKPNLQCVRVALPDGSGNKRMLVCVQCIRSGAIRKAVKRAPFALPATKKGS